MVNISPTFSAVSNAVSVNITGRVIRYPASPPQLRGMPRPLGGGIKHRYGHHDLAASLVRRIPTV